MSNRLALHTKTITFIYMNKKSLVVSGIFLIVCGVIGFYVYNTEIKTDEDTNEDVIMCTMDALICPDGSGVGRTGKQCTFSPCPSGNSYIGEFKQGPDGFKLIMEAQKGIGNETSYVMPLQIKVTNILNQFLGKKVRVYGTFIQGNTFLVESMEEVIETSLETGIVHVGETTYINRVLVTLHSVVQDSRCPADAQCIEAGAITARVTLKSDTDTETFNMPSDEVPHRFDSYKVSIIDIQPSRMSGKEVNPKDYILTFKVEAL